MPIESWTPATVIAATRAELRARMPRVGQIVADQVKRLLNRAQPTTKAGPSGRRRGLDPSKPGEPPKRLESRLIGSVTHETIDEPAAVVTRVGTNVVYARRLELGFTGTDARGRNVRQAPRPFLRRGLAEKRDEAARIIGVTG